MAAWQTYSLLRGIGSCCVQCICNRYTLYRIEHSEQRQQLRLVPAPTACTGRAPLPADQTTWATHLQRFVDDAALMRDLLLRKFIKDRWADTAVSWRSTVHGAYYCFVVFSGVGATKKLGQWARPLLCSDLCLIVTIAAQHRYRLMFTSHDNMIQARHYQQLTHVRSSKSSS